MRGGRLREVVANGGSTVGSTNELLMFPGSCLYHVTAIRYMFAQIVFRDENSLQTVEEHSKTIISSLQMSPSSPMRVGRWWGGGGGGVGGGLSHSQ